MPLKALRDASVLLLVVMMLATSAYAAAPVGNVFEGIQVRWTNTSKVDVLLSFEGTTAECGAYVKGNSGTTEITASVILARKNTNGTYTTVKTWTGLSATGTTFTFSDTHGVTRGYTYRLTIAAKVTRNGATESVSSWIENRL